MLFIQATLFFFCLCRTSSALLVREGGEDLSLFIVFFLFFFSFLFLDLLLSCPFFIHSFVDSYSLLSFFSVVYRLFICNVSVTSS